MSIREVNGCFCCGLKTGTIVIGILQTLLGLIMFVLCVLGMVEVGKHEDSESEYSDEFENKSVLIGLIIGSLVQIICSVLLVLGATLRRPCFLLPWLVLGTIGLVGYAIKTVIMIFLLPSFGFIMISLLIGAISCTIMVYQLLVVHSLRQQLKRENRQQHSQC